MFSLTRDVIVNQVIAIQPQQIDSEENNVVYLYKLEECNLAPK